MCGIRREKDIPHLLALIEPLVLPEPNVLRRANSGANTIDRLIVNSPYEEPVKHWRYDRQTRLFDLADGRRPAGYVVASSDSKAFDDPGVFIEIPVP